MIEKKYEQLLNIKTTGLREWRKETAYHRYEATPYKALEALFKVYKLDEQDKVMDFGCGRGRVPFFVHRHFEIPVTGVEVNDTTFEEALDNKRSYRFKANHIAAPIKLHYALAEQIEIPKEANVFYFFNPFSVEIFKQVMCNILASVEAHERVIDIILYYPTGSYKRFIDRQTACKLINKVPVPGAKDRKEKFLIYRFTPTESR